MIAITKHETDSYYVIIFIKFLLEYSCFTILCQFILYSKVNQLCVYIYPLFFGFPSHLGYHRALSRVPCVIQQVLISYLFYTQYQQCIYVNPNLPIPPIPHFLPWYPHVHSLHLCLYFCFANKFIYIVFLVESNIVKYVFNKNKQQSPQHSVG